METELMIELLGVVIVMNTKEFVADLMVDRAPPLSLTALAPDGKLAAAVGLASRATHAGPLFAVSVKDYICALISILT